MSVWSTVSFARSILDIAVSFFNQVADWIASLVFPLGPFIYYVSTYRGEGRLENDNKYDYVGGGGSKKPTNLLM